MVNTTSAFVGRGSELHKENFKTATLKHVSFYSYL